MQTGERQEVAGAALAEELACGSVDIGAIAERHGRKQGGGVPIEVRSVVVREMRANMRRRSRSVSATGGASVANRRHSSGRFH